jgi:hypothetical protein
MRIDELPGGRSLNVSEWRSPEVICLHGEGRRN